MSNKTKTHYMQEGCQKGTITISKEWLSVLSWNFKIVFRGKLRKEGKHTTNLFILLEAHPYIDKNLKKPFYLK